MPEPRDVDPAELQRWLAQASPDGLWVFDREGRTVYANDRLAELLGRSPDDMPGLSVFETLDEVGRGQFAQHLRQLEQTGQPGDNLECLFVRRDGSRLWALVSHTRIHDDAGRPVGWLHRVSDYSQQRRLIESLQRSEQQLAEAQHIARIGSWEWDVLTDTVTWSDELYRIYELDRVEDLTPTYQGFVDRIHPDDRADVEATVQAAMETGTFVFDARVIGHDGGLKWIRGRGQATRDAEGRVVRMGGTAQDVTETKDAEQALALLTSMATAANEATTITEVIPRILAQVAEHTGWRAVAAWRVSHDGELVAVPGRTRPAPQADVDEARRLARAATRSLMPEISRSTEGTHLVAAPVVAEDRAACVVVMDTRATTPPTDSDSVTVGQASALFAHVAEREWAAERLARARDDAMRASRAKSDFLATMSHEIRTPLNGVIGLSELLGRTELSPQQQRLADGIDSAGRSLLGLVNDILDLSKIEAGRLELERVEFDPTNVVEQATTLSAERARAKALELAVTCSPDVPRRVLGDPVRFGQVVANLTANAVKFTAAGEVVVRCTVESARDGHVQLRVDVSDTGSGISPEVQARLFTAFSQGDTSTTREYGGTGLGLAISRQLVTAMGGRIGVNSEEGAGSTFWFTATFDAAGDGSAPPPPTSSVIAGLRALVVDDNETNRFILEEQLAGWKVDTVVASSGVQGLGLLDEAERQGAPFDLVLLDYVMPGVNGEQFARMVRADTRFDATRIILLTSAMDLDAGDIAAAGIDASLLKPVLPSALLDTLNTVGAAGRQAHVPPEPAPAPDAPRQQARALDRGRVLVVEDNEVNQLVAAGILESLGFTVDLAENGLAGYYSFQNADGAYDAVLMDCQMPQMDGYDATRAIRAFEDGRQHVPVIAMTASAIAGERERCLESGMDDFLTKPVDIALLAEVLDRLVGPRPAAPDAPSGPVRPSAAPTGTGTGTDAATEGTAPSTPDPGAGLRPDHAAALDLDRLAELLELDPDDPSLLLRMLDRFDASTAETMDMLRSAHAAGDAHGQGRAAHRLKGTSSNLGAATLASLCLEVELLGDDGVLVPDAVLDQLEQQRRLAVDALRAYREGIRAG